MKKSIFIDGLTKYYEDFLALDGLSLEIEENEDVALLGPNGAGKSTALKLICGLLFPSSGDVKIEGVSIRENREKVAGKLGVILETPEFYPYLTPRETLNYLGELRKVPEDNLDERIDEVLETVKLEKWKDTKIEKFSRGMKQRLAISQALLHDPSILLLDEPSLGLDPRGMSDVRDILVEERESKTVLLASHLLNEVVRICDKVALIDHGELRTYNTTKNLEAEHGSLEEAYMKLTEGSE